jgi:curved DNA-binding protein CbpA
MKMEIKRCFEILDLDPGASQDEAKQAYKDIVNVWHPDRFSGNLRLKEKAEGKIKEINAAYDTVKSFLSSKQTREPGKQETPAARSNAEARDNTEAMVEAGTNIILSACSYFYQTIRRFVADQAQKLEEKAESGGAGPAWNERQSRGSGHCNGRGMGKGRGGGMRRDGGMGGRKARR